MATDSQAQEPRAAFGRPISALGRACLCILGATLVGLGGVGLLWRQQDGAGVAVSLLAGAVTLAIGVLGVIPLRLKVGSTEWEFEAIGRVAQEVERLSDERPEPQPESPLDTNDITPPLFGDQDRRRRLFDELPAAALLAQFAEMEEQINWFSEELGEPWSSGSARPRRPALGKLVREMQKSGHLSQWHVEMVQNLHKARNVAAHSPIGLRPFEENELWDLVEACAEVANDVAGRRRSMHPQEDD